MQSRTSDQRDVLRCMLERCVAYKSDCQEIELHSGLSAQSVQKVQQLVKDSGARQTLEIGMAMGISTLAILEALDELGDGTHVAIDPNQSDSGTDGWNGIGLEMVRRAGLRERLELFEDPSHLVLPRLLNDKRQFDFIFIDGWHSFDYTFVDYFYSDLLLNEGGILVFDDVGMPQVHHVTWFLETHKSYVKLGPSTTHPLSPVFKMRRKLAGADAGFDREWGSICAYRKIQTTQVPWAFFYSDFYPYYRLYKHWLRLRGLELKEPNIPE